MPRVHRHREQPLLLHVADDDGATLHDEARVVGLGKGLGDQGLFRPDRMDAAAATLADYADRARALGVLPQDILAVATSAARRALNARTFFARIDQETGIRVQIVSGAEEARLTWLGALGDLRLPSGPVAVLDLGAEAPVVVGQGAEVATRMSSWSSAARA